MSLPPSARQQRCLVTQMHYVVAASNQQVAALFMVKPTDVKWHKFVGQPTTLPSQWLLLTDTNVPFSLTYINVHCNVVVKCLN